MAREKKADRATAVPPEAMGTKKTKVAGARKLIGAMQGSPEWPAAPNVQTTTAAWAKATDDWEANDEELAVAKQKVAAIEAREPVLERRWHAKKRACSGAVTDHGDGSKDKVHALGWAVLNHDPLAPAEVPQNLRDKHSKVHGTATAGWDTNHGKFQFQVQHATNPADAATLSEPMTTGKSTFKLPGQVRGATIHFRVLTLDPKLPTGKTDWTLWVPVVVG